MSGVISILDEREFEKWLINRFPKIFAKWENEASELLDLDEYIDREHYLVMREWFKYGREKSA